MKVNYGQQFPPADEFQNFVSGQDLHVQRDIRSAGGRQHHILFFGTQGNGFGLIAMGISVSRFHEALGHEAAQDIGLIITRGGDEGVHVHESGGPQHVQVRSIPVQYLGMF